MGTGRGGRLPGVVEGVGLVTSRDKLTVVDRSYSDMISSSGGRTAGEIEMTEENTKTWLDIMPVLPLNRSVPIRHRRTLERGVVVAWFDNAGHPHAEPSMVYATSHPFGKIVECYCGGFRVDLEDRQGFGYALRQWWIRCGGTADVQQTAWHEQALWRWVQGDRVDADCMTLARALSEVRGG